MRRLFYILGAFALFLGFSDHALSNLSITPTRVVFQENQRYSDVVLVNPTREKKVYEISLLNKSMNENGEIFSSDSFGPGEFSAFNAIYYAPRIIEIGPGGKQKVRIVSRINANYSDGEYRSHLLFREVIDDNQKSGINSQTESLFFAISIPIILRKGNLSYGFSLSNPQISEQASGTFLVFDINREGNMSLFGDAAVYWKREKIGELKNVATYLSVAHRKVFVKLPNNLLKTYFFDSPPLHIVFRTEDKEFSIDYSPYQKQDH